MTSPYLRVVHLIDLSHRLFMDLLQVELEKRICEPSVTPVQALILFNLADQELSIGDITERGCYLGTRVSHSLDKLIEGGWLERRKCPHDRRATLVRATATGRELQSKLAKAFEQHAGLLDPASGAENSPLSDLTERLEGIASFWRTMALPPSQRQPRREAAQPTAAQLG